MLPSPTTSILHRLLGCPSANNTRSLVRYPLRLPYDGIRSRMVHLAGLEDFQRAFRPSRLLQSTQPPTGMIE